MVADHSPERRGTDRGSHASTHRSEAVTGRIVRVAPPPRVPTPPDGGQPVIAAQQRRIRVLGRHGNDPENSRELQRTPEAGHERWRSTPSSDESIRPSQAQGLGRCGARQRSEPVSSIRSVVGVVPGPRRRVLRRRGRASYGASRREGGGSEGRDRRDARTQRAPAFGPVRQQRVARGGDSSEPERFGDYVGGRVRLSVGRSVVRGVDAAAGGGAHGLQDDVSATVRQDDGPQ